MKIHAKPVTKMLKYKGGSWFLIEHCLSHEMPTFSLHHTSYLKLESLILVADHKIDKLANLAWSERSH